MNASASAASAPLSCSTRRTRFLGAQTPERLWNILTYPLLLLAFTLALFLLYLVSLWLPQLPGELRTEATAAQRWFAGASTPWGGAGGLLRNLGLFDVLHSLLFQSLLGVIGFLLLLQVAQTITTIVRLRRVPKVLDRTDAVNGEPLPLLEHTAFAALAQCTSRASPQLGEPVAATDGSPFRPCGTENSTGERSPSCSRRRCTGRADVDGRGEPPAASDSPVLEERLLGVRGLQSVLLAPSAAGRSLAGAAVDLV